MIDGGSLTSYNEVDMHEQRRMIRLFQPVLVEDMERAALDVLRSGQIAAGPLVARFEGELSTLLGRPHVVSTSDMTHAITLALRVSGIGRGDEVATLAYSCLSSTSAISQVGATPIWVDIDPATATMSFDDLARATTSRTKAVLLYHVAGYPGPVEQVRQFCRDKRMVLIEDCNNALGARIDGKCVGEAADFSVYSFYPNRQVNTLEGGALGCPNEHIAQRVSRLRRFGIDAARFRDAIGEIDPRCDVPEIGESAALSQFAASLGLAQLPSLESRLRRTRAVAARLSKASRDWKRAREVCPLPQGEPAYWSFLVQVDDRDAVLRRLKESGIQASKLHQRNDDYTGFRAKRRSMAGTDTFMSEVLALPCGWWLCDADLDYLEQVLWELLG